MKSFDTPQQYLDHIASADFDVRTPRDAATFWSGDKVANDTSVNGREQVAGNGAEYRPVNRNAARTEQLVESGEQSRLESTPGGRWLEGQDLSSFKDAERSQIWNAASEKYAASASGDVTTRVVGAEDTRVFRSTELPTLVANESVTSINGVPREELQALHAKDPDAAYLKVCEGEVARGHEQVAARDNRISATDVQQRESLHAIQTRQITGAPDSRGDTTLRGAPPTAANDNGPGPGPPGFQAPPPPPPPPPPEDTAERSITR